MLAMVFKKVEKDIKALHYQFRSMPVGTHVIYMYVVTTLKENFNFTTHIDMHDACE